MAATTVTVVGRTPTGQRRIGDLHHVAAATGFRPDLAMLGELRLVLPETGVCSVDAQGGAGGCCSG